MKEVVRKLWKAATGQSKRRSWRDVKIDWEKSEDTGKTLFGMRVLSNETIPNGEIYFVSKEEQPLEKRR